jgi:hypothetical protein
MMLSLRSLFLLCWMIIIQSVLGFSSHPRTLTQPQAARTKAPSARIPLSALSSLSSSSSSSSDDALSEVVDENSPDRRAVFGTLAALTATACSFALSPLMVRTNEGATTITGAQMSEDEVVLPINIPSLSLDQALEIIEASCDKRFLHAVVASDYQLLYQQGTKLEIHIRQESEQFATTTGTRTGVFEELEHNQLRDRPLQPSASQLALSNIESAKKKWGRQVVSVWPLMSDHDVVHYAWPEAGGAFRTDSKIIVDGIDCGKMSLEDALDEETNMQVLVQAKQFLVVPHSMERQLVEKLQGAFLI